MRIGGIVLLALAAGIAGCGVSTTPDDDAALVGEAPPLDVVGTWYRCGGAVVFGADGTLHNTDLSRGCTGDGTYVVHGAEIDFAWAGSPCAATADGPHPGTRAAHTLAFIDPSTGGVTSYFDATTPRSLWHLEATDGSGRTSTMSIVGTPHLLQGCYWSTDGGCGGLFSCGGYVSDWTTDDTAFHATVTCNGHCPCGAVLDGTRSATGGYDATYTGANCDHTFNGTFSAQTIPWE